MPTTYDPATVDMSDFPASGFPYDDPFVYPAHSNRIVSGKELAQLQAAFLRGYRYSNENERGSLGARAGTLPGTPSIPLPENYVVKTLLADANDLSILNNKTTVLRITPSGAGRLWTGLAGGVHGRRVTVINAGALFLTLKAESTSSQALNRFALVTDISLWTNDSVVLEYDGISGRWRCVAKHVCQPIFGVYPSSTKSANNVTFTSPDWNTEDYDSHGWFDNATNYQYLPLLPGKYLFSFRVGIAAVTDADECLCSLFTNKSAPDTETARSIQITTGGANDVCLTGSAIIQLDGVDDYVRCKGYQGSGGALNLQAGPLRSYFSGIRIGD